MPPKIEIERSSKNHAVILLDGQEFCTLYGSDWKKRFNRLKDALRLEYIIRNDTMQTVNACIKEIRKK